MNRRHLFRALAQLAGAGALVAAAPVRKFGRLTVDGHRAHLHTTGEFLRVTVDGVDVTGRSYEADDGEGYVLAYCGDPAQHRDWTAQGHKHVGGDGTACRMRLTGAVVIAPGAKR
jgi:hypothetical protein